ncbi:type II toxin-antitoxin system RatA family toxin [Oxalobacteraceae bacterium CAVE-383]|nr:type II toxin-antitoxin system RatA family toxin [Oxalobacteraceae bacterium CAVE-383]
MAVVHKTVLIGYSAEQMFTLVDRVEDYPQFLPWCGGVEVRDREEHKLIAKININYHGLRQSFTTENTNAPPHAMTMRLIEGPFKHFEGTWKFHALRADACKIEFDMHYEFSSRLFESVIGPVFSVIANSFVDSFCKRAEAVYG